MAASSNDSISMASITQKSMARGGIKRRYHEISSVTIAKTSS